MGDLRAGPGQPKKATEGSSNRIEHSGGKGIKLLVDKRDDGGAVAPEHRLKDWVIGEPHIDALGQQSYGCRVGASANQAQKLGNRCRSTWGIHSGTGTRNEETRFSGFLREEN